MKRLVAISILFLFVPMLAFAHGNEQHVMGIVSSVTNSSITVETKDHGKVTVRVVAETKFARGPSEVTLKDLKVGDRVVIHAVKQGEQIQGHTVQIGTASAAAGRQHGTQ